jgi:hypothetical protein
MPLDGRQLLVRLFAQAKGCQLGWIRMNVDHDAVSYGDPEGLPFESARESDSFHQKTDVQIAEVPSRMR